MRGITNTSQIYQHTPISKDEGLSMRGIAILCIIFHNFLHLHYTPERTNLHSSNIVPMCLLTS